MLEFFKAPSSQNGLWICVLSKPGLHISKRSEHVFIAPYFATGSPGLHEAEGVPVGFVWGPEEPGSPVLGLVRDRPSGPEGDQVWGATSPLSVSHAPHAQAPQLLPRAAAPASRRGRGRNHISHLSGAWEEISWAVRSGKNRNRWREEDKGKEAQDEVQLQGWCECGKQRETVGVLASRRLTSPRITSLRNVPKCSVSLFGSYREGSGVINRPARKLFTNNRIIVSDFASSTF